MGFGAGILGAAAVMAVFVCGILVSRNLGAQNGRSRWKTDLSLALVAGLLVTLKSTLAIFGVFFLGALYFCSCWRGPIGGNP